jgi:four helix bundle protein
MERLEKNITFADLIHAETADFPVDGRFGLTNQIRRAATSIASISPKGRQGRTPISLKFIPTPRKSVAC